MTRLSLIAGFALALTSAALSPTVADGSEQPKRPVLSSGDPLPAELEGVDIKEKLSARLPTAIEFISDRGQLTTLGDVLASGRPTILTFNYSSCPLLCSVQLGGLTQALALLEPPVGESYQVVTISLDPTETAATAAETKASYLARLSAGRQSAGKRPALDADQGWTFLVGTEESVRAAADSVGFGYAFHPERKEYLHPAAFIMVTPAGDVAQYVYGVSFDPVDLEAAITSATLGVTTESLQKFILSCYHYEAKKGFDAFGLMQIVGISFGIAVIFAIAMLHLRSRRAAKNKDLAGRAVDFPRTENRA